MSPDTIAKLAFLRIQGVNVVLGRIDKWWYLSRVLLRGSFHGSTRKIVLEM